MVFTEEQTKKLSALNDKRRKAYEDYRTFRAKYTTPSENVVQLEDDSIEFMDMGTLNVTKENYEEFKRLNEAMTNVHNEIGDYLLSISKTNE